ncbi:APC family permease [Treponema sp. OMZ 792]|uniref:APC family permease n=1 Tax=unclassified Treponema TaxID=2638727 RepID=UPI0020A5E4ED|nr:MULTISPECIES: APC family permease [unclassified Treponema]UTC61408.1 APC family permease [Treponema sp. OMZ 787]UTC76089.1 APC family permease [Treponema sp. OMZ 792]UTC80090.1 APC family permease [Treponema sp. OMZ 798]
METTKEKRNLNLFNIFSLGFGGAVGSGIFVLTGLGIAATGKSILVSIMAGCIFMLLAYFYNVLLSSMFMFEGGDYSQKALVFNPFFTGVNGYITFINGFSVAMYGLAMVNYAGIVLPQIIPYTKLIAIIIITLFFAATIRGSKFISTINNIMTVVLIAAIVFYIVFGIPKVKPGYFSDPNFFTDGFKGVIAGIAIMGWACQGTTMGPVSVSAVTMKPKKNIPYGIFLVTIAIAIVYGLMGYVSAGVLPISEVAGQNLSLVAAEIFPRSIFILFIMGGAVFAIATSMITGIIMVRYPILKVAQAGWLPKFFTKTTKTGYPWAVYGIYYILSILPVLLGLKLDAIVSLVMIPAMLTNLYTNIKCIKVIRDYPEQWKKSVLHMPRIIMDIICILSALCAAIVCYNLFMMLSTKEKLFMIGIMVIISILSIYNLKAGNVKIEELEANKKQIIEDALLAETEE